jgi:hypothetical protein
MRVNCLGCGQYIDLDESYDDYEGEIKCNSCGALVDVDLSKGEVKSVQLLEQDVTDATEGENKPGA